MKDKVLKRAVEESGVPRILEILGDEISLSDLQSLLLEVGARQAARITPSALLKNHAANRFARPSDVAPATLLKLDRLALAALPRGYEALDLSPVCPLGACSALAPVHQDRVLTALRSSEAVADATNVLALEAALRRRTLLRHNPKSTDRVGLAASHRQIRTQPFDDPKFSAHFKMVALVTAGRDTGDRNFETRALMDHLGFHIRFLNKALARSTGRVSFELLLTPKNREMEDLLQQRLIPRLCTRYPAVKIGFFRERTAAINYYSGMCFNFRISGDFEGSYDFAVDGGFTDWTQQLLNNRKERLLTSGVGTELLARILAG